MPYEIVLTKEDKHKDREVISGIGDLEREEIPPVVSFLTQAWVNDNRSVEINQI